MIAILKFTTVNGTKVILPFDNVLAIELSLDSVNTKIAMNNGLAYLSKLTPEQLIADALTFVGSEIEE